MSGFTFGRVDELWNYVERVFSVVCGFGSRVEVRLEEVLICELRYRGLGNRVFCIYWGLGFMIIVGF